MLLVRRGHDRERVAPRALAQAGAGRVGERRRQQLLDPRQPFAREPERAGRVRRRTPRRPRAARSRRGRSRRTRRTSSRAAGSPRATAASAGTRARARRAPRRRRPASRRRRSRNRVSASNARAFGSGSANSRSIASAPISPTREAVRLLARRAVRADELDAGDGVQLARALVQHQLGVRQRLEPRAEARLRLAHALRDRADPSAFAGIDMQDAIRLGEAQRPEHDGLGLVRPAHAASLEGRSGVSRVRIYTTRWCGYCQRAKALLDRWASPTRR